MKEFEKFIRFSPKLFVFAAVVDLIKQIQELVSFKNQIPPDSEYYTSGLISRAFDVLLFPLGWLGSAIVITLLLALYDARIGGKQ